MTDDYKQRVAEALAEKFTRPIHRCDKWGENEWIENPEPDNRVEQAMTVHFIAGDGHPSFRMVTCSEAAEVVAAVRDEDMRRLRYELEQWHAAYGEKALPGMLARLRAAEERAERAEAALADTREKRGPESHGEPRTRPGLSHDTEPAPKTAPRRAQPRARPDERHTCA